MGGFLDFFSSDSQTDNTTSNVDQSKALSANVSAGGDLVQAAPVISSDQIGTLNLTDQGAIKGATDLLKSGVTDIVSGSSKITDQASKAVSDALKLADKARQTDTQSVFSNIGTWVKWGALGVAAYFLGRALFSKAK